MAMVKCLRSGNRYYLTGTLLVAFLSLVSVECVVSAPEVTSSKPESSSLSTTNNANQDGQTYQDAVKKDSYTKTVCYVGKECIMDCSPFLTKNENGDDITWKYNSTETKERGPILKHTFNEVINTNGNRYTCKKMSNGVEKEIHHFSIFVRANETNKPLIVVKPYDRVVAVGKITEIMCAIDNTITANVTWLHKGIPVEENSNLTQVGGILKINPVTENHFGNYTCKANSTGEEDSASAFLYIEEPWENYEYDLDLIGDNKNLTKPYFITAKKPNSTLLKKPATYRLRLKCPAAGYPTPNITWVKNGEPIKPELVMVDYRNWSMEIRGAITDDSGSYTCTVCNNLGCINSTYDVIIDGNSSKIMWSLDDTKQDIRDIGGHLRRPHIKFGYPANITVAIGGNASFSCPTDDGTAANTTRWIKSTCEEIEHSYDELNKHSRILSEAKDYDIVNVTRTDEGWYSCVLSSNLGTGEICKQAYLETYDGTTPQGPVRHVLCFTGEDCIIDCPLSSSQNESNTAIHWFHHSHPKGHGRKLNLKFENKTDRVGDWYTCEVMSSGDTTKVHSIGVHVVNKSESESIKPIVGKPISRFVNLNQFLVQFECVTLNTIHADNVTWLHDGRPIEKNSYFIPNGTYLQIHNVDETLLGEYTCEVKSKRGTDFASAYLYTEGTEVTAVREPNSTVSIMKPATRPLRLNCSTEGYSTPNITWLKDDKPIKPELGVVEYRGWSMEIKEAIPDDSGSYVCQVCSEQHCTNNTYDVTIIDEASSENTLNYFIFDHLSGNLTEMKRHQKRPYIKDGYPAPITVTVGDNASFSCPTNDSTAANTRWIKSTCEEIERSYDELNKHSRILSEAKDYNIVNVSRTNEGWYSCVLSTNSSKGEICRHAQLRVNDTVNQETPWYLKWYFIAGVASLVVVIVITAIALNYDYIVMSMTN